MIISNNEGRLLVGAIFNAYISILTIGKCWKIWKCCPLLPPYCTYLISRLRPKWKEYWRKWTSSPETKLRKLLPEFPKEGNENWFIFHQIRNSIDIWWEPFLDLNWNCCWYVIIVNYIRIWFLDVNFLFLVIFRIFIGIKKLLALIEMSKQTEESRRVDLFLWKLEDDEYLKFW